MQALLSLQEILKYIPQRAPFVMVDKLYKIENGRAETGLYLSRENILMRMGVFQESGIIENMAQSAALLAGYHAGETGSEPKKGFIGMIKDLRVYELPVCEQEIFSVVERSSQIMNAEIVMGEVSNSAGMLLAECELRIFVENE